MIVVLCVANLLLAFALVFWAVRGHAGETTQLLVVTLVTNMLNSSVHMLKERLGKKPVVSVSIKTQDHEPQVGA